MIRVKMVGVTATNRQAFAFDFLVLLSLHTFILAMVRFVGSASVAPLSQPDLFGGSEPSPGYSNVTQSSYQNHLLKHAVALHFSWHKIISKYAEAFLKR